MSWDKVEEDSELIILVNSKNVIGKKLFKKTSKSLVENGKVKYSSLEKRFF